MRVKEIETKHFEHTNKPGKYLTWQLKKKRAKKTITKIKNNEKEITSPKGIKRSFYKYYANVFKKQNISTAEIEKYLEKANIKGVTDETN